jgi:PEP-CTERM motif
MGISGFKKALVVAGFSAFSSIASAAFIETFEGTDCAGVFGTPFAACTIPARIDPNETPVIIKFNFAGGDFSVAEINDGLFPTIDGSEFDFSGVIAGGGTGTWTYTPGAGDPGINFFVAKGGDFFNLFSNLGDPLSDDWLTPTNPANDQLFDLSHLTFYDTDNGGDVPEPTTLLLLGAGLFAAGFARRRVKRD